MMSLGLSALVFNACKDEQVLPSVSITSVSPEEGHSGDTITISGKHFNSGNGTAEVFFNATPSVIANLTADELQVIVPGEATSGTISVMVNGKLATSSNDFTILQPPIISAFSPEAGGIGSTVTIDGVNFSAVTSQNTVTFNGIVASVTTATATQLTVTVPQSATTGKIAIAVKGKSFSTTNNFTVVPTNEWLGVADFTGPGRYYAVAFVVGNKGYIGTGRRSGGVRAKDLWEYNTESNAWTQKADLPAVGREYATSFSIGTKGYLGLGSNGFKQKDIWEYDPQSNVWTRKDDFGGGDRSNAFAFVAGGKAYVGAGMQGDQHVRMRDLWEFDPSKTAGQQWVQKQNIGGPDYTGEISGLPAAAFTVSGKGYVALPLSDGTKPDLWEFNPANNTWTSKQKTPFDILSSSESVSFVIQEKGFVLSGAKLWKYDVAGNSWQEKAAFPLAGIRYATGFSNGNHAFVGLGYTTGESLKFYKYYSE
jgi:hypothetical protein